MNRTPSKDVLELLASIRLENNKNDKGKDNTVITSSDDVNGLLSPTIDDVISNLNPNRPIFPSPITLIDRLTFV